MYFHLGSPPLSWILHSGETEMSCCERQGGRKARRWETQASCWQPKAGELKWILYPSQGFTGLQPKLDCKFHSGNAVSATGDSFFFLVVLLFFSPSNRRISFSLGRRLKSLKSAHTELTAILFFFNKKLKIIDMWNDVSGDKYIRVKPALPSA